MSRSGSPAVWASMVRMGMVMVQGSAVRRFRLLSCKALDRFADVCTRAPNPEPLSPELQQDL